MQHAVGPPGTRSSSDERRQNAGKESARCSAAPVGRVGACPLLRRPRREESVLAAGAPSGADKGNRVDADTPGPVAWTRSPLSDTDALVDLVPSVWDRGLLPSRVAGGGEGWWWCGCLYLAAHAMASWGPPPLRDMTRLALRRLASAGLRWRACAGLVGATAAPSPDPDSLPSDSGATRHTLIWGRSPYARQLVYAASVAEAIATTDAPVAAPHPLSVPTPWRNAPHVLPALL